jgi:hypothetical protein
LLLRKQFHVYVKLTKSLQFCDIVASLLRCFM